MLLDEAGVKVYYLSIKCSVFFFLRLIFFCFFFYPTPFKDYVSYDKKMKVVITIYISRSITDMTWKLSDGLPSHLAQRIEYTIHVGRHDDAT